MEYEGHEYSFVSALDVSERKSSEAQLRLTQFSVDNSASQIFWVDEDARLVAVNESMCRQLGYTHDEMLRLTIYDIDPTAPQPWSTFWETTEDRAAASAPSRRCTPPRTGSSCRSR